MEEQTLNYDHRDDFVRLGDVVLRIGSVVYVLMTPDVVQIAMDAPSRLTGELTRLTLRGDDAEAARRYFTDAKITAP